MNLLPQWAKDGLAVLVFLFSLIATRLTPSRQPRVRKSLKVAFAISLILFIVSADFQRPANPPPVAAKAVAVEQAKLDNTDDDELRGRTRHVEERAFIVLAVVAAGQLLLGLMWKWLGYSVKLALHRILIGSGSGLLVLGLVLPLTLAVAFGVYLLVIGHTWEAVKQTTELAAEHPKESNS